MKAMDAECRALRILQEHLPENDLHPGIDAQEIRGRSGQSVVIALVKRTGVARIDDLIGRFSAAALQLQGDRAPGCVLIALVGVNRIGKRSAAAVEEFLSRFAPWLGWGVFDDSGGLRLHIPKLHIERFDPPRPLGSKKTGTGRVFTDLNRWLLKILLLSESPPANFPEGKRGKPRNPNELGELAGVSHETAYQFFRRMQRRRYLARTHRGFQFVAIDELLSDWLHEDGRSMADRVPVRGIICDKHHGPFPLDAVLEPALRSMDVAIGGFEACSRLGLLHTRYALPEVHVRERLERVLESLAVEVCEPRDAEFNLIRSPYPESIFRGAQVLHRIPIVDSWQAALDVIGIPARGMEQAEFIAKRVASWGAHDG